SSRDSAEKWCSSLDRTEYRGLRLSPQPSSLGPKLPMSYDSFRKAVTEQLREIRAAGLYKTERQLLGPQGAEIRVAQGQGQGEVLNLCANNYLGLANHPDVLRAAADGLRQYGYGMASVRFIRATRTLLSAWSKP